MDEFACLLAALDLVLLVDNSAVHLGGALGVPTWMLVPQLPNWRWQFGRTDSPWYASVRLFRQTVGLHWEPVRKRVNQALSSWFSLSRQDASYNPITL